MLVIVYCSCSRWMLRRNMRTGLASASPSGLSFDFWPKLKATLGAPWAASIPLPIVSGKAITGMVTFRVVVPGALRLSASGEKKAYESLTTMQATAPSACAASTFATSVPPFALALARRKTRAAPRIVLCSRVPASSPTARQPSCVAILLPNLATSNGAGTPSICSVVSNTC